MAVSRVLVSSSYAEPNDTSHTFYGLNAGAESSDRLLFAFVTAKTDGGLKSCTIGGVPATKEAGEPSATAFTTEVWWALAPSGLAADVEIASDSAIAAAHIALYRVVGAETRLPVSGVAKVISNMTPASVALDVPENGAAIAIACGSFRNASLSLSWVGADEDAEDGESLKGVVFGAASIAKEDAIDGYTISAAIGSEPIFRSLPVIRARYEAPRMMTARR